MPASEKPSEYSYVLRVYDSKGRLAFYLKGKIKGKYLLTAAVDTADDDLDKIFLNFGGKDPRRLLRRLAPYDYSPIYGADSADGYIYGGRAQHWGNDKIRVGATGMDETTGLADQQAYGAEVEVSYGTHGIGGLAALTYDPTADVGLIRAGRLISTEPTVCSGQIRGVLLADCGAGTVILRLHMLKIATVCPVIINWSAAQLMIFWAQPGADTYCLQILFMIYFLGLRWARNTVSDFCEVQFRMESDAAMVLRAIGNVPLRIWVFGYLGIWVFYGLIFM